MKPSKSPTTEKQVSRRSFLKSTSSAVVAGVLIHQLNVNASSGDTLTESLAAQAQPATKLVHSQRLLTGWDYRRGGLGGVWEVWRKANDDANTWTPVELPHCFNALDAVDPDAPYYQGPGWYRTRLKLANPYPSGRTLLHFEGAGQKTEIFIFNSKIGTHVGGYDEFTFDITDAAAAALKNEANKGLVPVAVHCDSSRDLEMIPSNLSDFNLYGGLYRYLNLVYVPAISLERVHVDTMLTPQGKATVVIRARLYNPGDLKEELEFEIRVTDPAEKVVHNKSYKLASWSDARELSSFTIEKPTLWSPRSPALYRIVVSLKSPHCAMEVIERFGLRQFEFIKNGPFKLNGERLLIRGTQRHEDHAGVAAAMTEDIIRQEMRLVKELGANFIRLGHHQQSRIVLDLCDELGLLVWEEIPWCRGGLGGDRYKEQARRMLRNMIDQHRNHPSVIIWGLGNENDWPGDFEEFNKDEIRAFMIELNDLSHSLDPSRKTAIRRCDFCKDVIDVYSPSIWAGWYGGRYTEYKSRSETEMKKVNHFLHMEWGGDSHAGRHTENTEKVLAAFVAGQAPDERGLDYLLTGGVSKASSDGDWSETYICNLFDWHLKEQETMEWLPGTAQWIFKDFATTLRPGNPVPRVNQKGLVERDLKLKEGYFVFQSYWTEKPMVHIYGHSWPVRWGEKNESKLVKVYSNCPMVELFVNGKSAGVKKRNSQDFPAAGLRWLVPFNEGENRVKAVGRTNAAEVLDEITLSYQTAKWAKPAQLTLMETARNGDTITIEAKMQDQNGVFCLDARNVVRFGLVGNGKLIDNGGTARSARKVELANGRAEISLQRKGEVVVSVSSEGVATAFLKI
ncbi:MAG TPA: glycoside hydrolase family 2 TIM barrel-domain containing protein [Pyrinomonadaceae bacterium]|nr:glycoside hydrolase family 2 TIM barrel-domain containing protein [Pyrinomonadaceae bacterium]